MFKLETSKKQIKNILRIIKMSGSNIAGEKATAFDTNSSISEADYSFLIECEEIERVRVNLLIPSINKEDRYGGITTAISVFSTIASELGLQVLFRFLVTDREHSPEAIDYLSRKVKGASVEVLHVGFNKVIPIAQKDVFVATAWWTAYLAKEIIAWKVERYGEHYSRLFYIIQDFEPGFYAWSSRYALAESTYLEDSKTVAIFNSSLLKDFFLSRSYAFEKIFFFEPRMSEELRNHRRLSAEVRSKKIVFYGRPSAPRNCFEIIVDCFRKLSEANRNVLQSWEIVSVGEQHDDIVLGNKTIKSYGKLTLKEYAELMNKSAVGISLMLSPHPSYPPLEMAHFGMLTITNRYGSKDLSLVHDNILSLDIVSPDSLARAVVSAVLTFEKDAFAGSKGVSHMPEYLLDDNQFPFVKELCSLMKQQL